jgi:alpha-1,6-mannosyltransferase
LHTVVPRTFFGAFILAYLAKLIAFIIPDQILNLASRPMLVQFLIRLELLLLNWMACIRLARAVDCYLHELSKSSQKQKKNASTIQSTTGSYFLLITAAQFHIPFYSSRLLPNTFALLLVINAYADWFRGCYRRTAMYLVFTAGIFRCDMLLLLFTVGLCMLIQRRLMIIQALGVGIATGIAGLILTVPLDSLLWGRLIWPEFEVWWFNTVDNRSSEWGEMVWHWYFSRALPKGLMATTFLIPLAFVRLPEFLDKLRLTKNSADNKQQQSFFDWSLCSFFAPVFAFVVFYSFLPHKEIRFIFPAIPMFNVCAAYGMSRLHRVAFPCAVSHNKTSLVSRVMFICGLATIVLTLVASSIFLSLSRKNYPGGQALLLLRSHLIDTVSNRTKWNEVRVHVDVAAAMTGVSLFGQRHASIRQLDNNGYDGPFAIDKSGYEEKNKAGEAQMHSFTHLLTERAQVDGYHLIDTVKGNPRLNIKGFQIEIDDAIFIHERDNWSQ